MRAMWRQLDDCELSICQLLHVCARVAASRHCSAKDAGAHLVPIGLHGDSAFTGSLSGLHDSSMPRPSASWLVAWDGGVECGMSAKLRHAEVGRA